MLLVLIRGVDVNAHFLGCFVPIILANSIQFNIWGNYWRKLSGKMYIKLLTAAGYQCNG